MANEAKAQHANIAQALAAAQAQMGKAFKQTSNPHFKSKYADLATVIDACLPALNANGIAVIQPLTENEYGRSVVTRFVHTSGETVECPVPLILGKQDMQGLGSAMTYARRYGLMALAGIAPEDDDGNAAAASVAQKAPVRTWAQTITDELGDAATVDQKSEAIERALMAQFARKKTPGELNNEWDRRVADRCLTHLEKVAPERFERVRDAFQSRIDAMMDERRETAGMPT